MSASAANRTSRHQRRRRETAERILEAAVALFGERGVAGTRVAEICERADIAHQTFFNHFPTKQDLVRELVRRGGEFTLAAIESALRDGRTTGERLAQLFARIHTAAAAVGPMHQDLVSETLRVVHEVGDGGAAGDLQLHRSLQELLRSGRRQGDVTREHAVEDLVALVVGALSQLLFEWAHRPDYPIAERSARMARLLAAALAPRPGEKARRR